jgi:hypothetical protein
MYETRRSMLCGDPEHFEYFPVGRSGSVVNTEAYAECALLQTLLDLPLHFFDFGVGCCFVRAITARQEDARVVHHRNSNGNVSNARAIVD